MKPIVRDLNVASVKVKNYRADKGARDRGLSVRASVQIDLSCEILHAKESDIRAAITEFLRIKLS